MPDVFPPKQDNGSAAFVATGKIVKRNASTLPDVETTNTLIFQIESVIKSPSIFADLAGHQVTIRFDKLPDVKEGTEMTVYANGWIFGETVGLEAVTYTVASDRKSVAANVMKEATTNDDAQLKERVESAAVAVVGKVIKVEKKEEDPKLFSLTAANEKQTTQISEHDPNWHQATIQVDETLKGKGDKEVKVLFPKSDDVRWYGVHKFQEGQQGIWLLQNNKDQNTKGIAPKVLAAVPADTTAFTTLHANDFLPLAELGKVKSLLHN